MWRFPSTCYPQPIAKLSTFYPLSSGAVRRSGAKATRGYTQQEGHGAAGATGNDYTHRRSGARPRDDHAPRQRPEGAGRNLRRLHATLPGPRGRRGPPPQEPLRTAVKALGGGAPEAPLIRGLLKRARRWVTTCNGMA